MFKAKLQYPNLKESSLFIYPTNCTNGDYYHDRVNRWLFVCVSGRNKTLREWIDVKAVRCLYTCPNVTIGSNR
jgi:hypothetical protein